MPRRKTYVVNEHAGICHRRNFHFEKLRTPTVSAAFAASQIHIPQPQGIKRVRCEIPCDKCNVSIVEDKQRCHDQDHRMVHCASPSQASATYMTVPCRLYMYSVMAFSLPNRWPCRPAWYLPADESSHRFPNDLVLSEGIFPKNTCGRRYAELMAVECQRRPSGHTVKQQRSTCACARHRSWYGGLR